MTRGILGQPCYQNSLQRRLERVEASLMATLDHLRQRTLDFDPKPLPPVRDQRVQKRDRPRLGEMSRAILERLHRGPVSNAELAGMFPAGAAWRTRLSDVRFYLRGQGMTVRGEQVSGGFWMYRIERES